MAVFYLQHTGKGKAKYDRQGIVDHGRYVLRQSARGTIEARHADDYGQVLGWLDRLYDESRANARVIDTVIVNLRRELDASEQTHLIRSYLDIVTGGRTPYVFVIHTDKPDNPHAHIIIRDVDIQTGRRVAGLSKLGSSYRLRALWEAMRNRALRDQGIAISCHGKGSEHHRALNDIARASAQQVTKRNQMLPAHTASHQLNSPAVGVALTGLSMANVIPFPEPSPGAQATSTYNLPDIKSVLATDADLTRLRAARDQLRTLTADYKATQAQLDSVVKRMGDLATNVTKLTAAHTSATQTYADHRRWCVLLRGFQVFGWKSPTRVRAERARDNYRVATEVLEHTSNRLESVRKEHRVLVQMAKKMERTESAIRDSDINFGNDADLKDADVILRNIWSSLIFSEERPKCERRKTRRMWARRSFCVLKRRFSLASVVFSASSLFLAAVSVAVTARDVSSFKAATSSGRSLADSFMP
jgi:hypothetical protein